VTVPRSREQVGFFGYREPVDVYIALAYSGISETYLFDSSGALHPLSEGVVVKWRSNVDDFYLDESLLGVIPKSWLPPGTYTLLMVIAPTGTLSSFYAWGTYFVL
jgi:hypothetical protein